MDDIESAGRGQIRPDILRHKHAKLRYRRRGLTGREIPPGLTLGTNLGRPDFDIPVLTQNLFLEGYL